MATKILSVRFSQSVDMLQIGGGHSTVVLNTAPVNSPSNGVKATFGQAFGEKGILLQRPDDDRFMWIPLSSAVLAAIICQDEPEAAPVKK